MDNGTRRFGDAETVTGYPCCLHAWYILNFLAENSERVFHFSVFIVQIIMHTNGRYYTLFLISMKCFAIEYFI
jgi:hypothetical protein